MSSLFQTTAKIHDLPYQSFGIPKNRGLYYWKFRYIRVSEKVILIYRYLMQCQYFRYVSIPNIPSGKYDVLFLCVPVDTSRTTYVYNILDWD